MSGRNVPPIGVQANAFAGAPAPAGNAISPFLNTENSPFVSAFGHAAGATTINLLYSADGGNTSYIAHAVVLAGAGDFAIDCICGAQFCALQTTSSVVLTATIQAKGGGA